VFGRLLTSALLSQQVTIIPFEILKALPSLTDTEMGDIHMFRILLDFQHQKRENSSFDYRYTSIRSLREVQYIV